MENKLMVKENVQVLDSREVAEMMGKAHKELMRDIRGGGKNKGLMPILTGGNYPIGDFFIESTYIDAKGETRICYLITKMGCELLGNKLQGEKNILFNVALKKCYEKDLRESLGIASKDIQTVIRKEIEFGDLLKDSLGALNIEVIPQHIVLNYRIDFYIPSLNIAIEYDENNHSNYTYEKHEGRQINIEKELGCKFIRVTDENSHGYNLGLILKEILLGEM